MTLPRTIALVITRGDDFGGAQRHVLDMAKALGAAEWRVVVVTGSDGRLTDALSSAGVQVAFCRALSRSIVPLRDVLAVSQLTQLLRRLAPDICAIHSSKAGVVGRLACRLAHVPCVFTAHGWAFTEGVATLHRSFYACVERALAPLARRIICVSRYDYELAVEAGIPAERLTQIPNGIPQTDTLYTAQRHEARNPRAIMIARFGVPKDPVALLRALTCVPRIKLDLVGEGPTLEFARSEAAALGLNDRVRFLGYRDDTAHCLREADIFCLISNYEGFPYTTLEAMREGLPSLVSDVGGAGEAILEGKTGFLIPRGNIEILAQKLALLAKHENLRGRMGAAARQHFLANFTFDKMFNRTVKIYEEVLAGHN